ncbi:hypothetical protein [Planctomyces sp. SH-PL14]|uniref:hypothetical protein n=1 Tax=Planctomyces sp. SH-PL14 TaxID=1632864 RepID=UPI00078C73C2|nr:hypothetical protein [Planctomyces sp. SH-PL14]AMV20643.1 hypothetical protein VT03_22275 [Planctomyces sp. SH-PL14]
MDPQHWLDQLRTELQTRRLPRRYVTRLLRELSDHVTDEWENPMSKDAPQAPGPAAVPGPLERLGSPQLVAESAARELRARSFAARHPVWTFGVLPPLLAIVVAAALLLGPGALLDTLLDLPPLDEYETAPWVHLVAQGYVVGCIVAASLLVVLAFIGLARRCDLARRWPMTAALVTALVCGGLWTGATPKTAEKMGTVMVGLPRSLGPAGIAFPQLLQFAAPLALAAWLTRRRAHAALS